MLTMANHGRKRCVFFILAIFVSTCAAKAQDAADNSAHQETGSSNQTRAPKTSTASHKFWDGENVALFAGVAVVRGLDYSSTQHFRRRGVNEALLSNGIVDNKPLFATIEVAGTAASIGVSYLLHRTGHHRAERWVSIVHIGVATFGDIRNYGLSNPNFTGTVP